jgi:Tfp pilus assembly protein PilN
MINLLPPEQKKQIRAARSNLLLLRYNILLLGALTFLLIATAVTYFYLNNTKASSEKTIQENRAKVTDYRSVQQKADNFRSNLATAKQILDKDVTYTKVIIEISRLLPPGVTLDTLSLDSKTFGTSTTFAAKAKSYDAALALKDSLQKSTVFSNVYFASISGTGTGDYPINVNLNVTIVKEATR